MKKVFQTLGLAKAIEGLFGIEIEAEGKGMQLVDNKFWRTEDDGSLRGDYPESRAEFVLKHPITGDKVKPALVSLEKALEGAVFDFSFRTSVHVHVNVQELTHTQLLNFIYTYLLLEEPLMTYCGKERKGNRFCLRLADAEGMLGTLKKLFYDGSESIRDFRGDDIRYSAINIAALQKYGSLEFRAMRGNLEVDTICTWVEALGKIREYAITVKDPQEVLKEFQNMEPKEFLKSVLGGVSKFFIYPRMVKDMQRSLSLSIDLPYSYRDVKEDDPKMDRYRIARNKALRDNGYAEMPDDVPYNHRNPLDPQRDVLKYYDRAGMERPKQAIDNPVADPEFIRQMIAELQPVAPKPPKPPRAPR